ncbi:Phosphatidylinositol-3-phosphatase SAC1 [Entomophthora muscae]|uniref:Phosphatidylinositol-3-phosphatase SAC1 n=1 Tax=Entomophthora muscae TaxID=34485 RepID=A0ACC2S651_9FUNG|nr:Phosphatidylinositol-3-phosphatase SAC1 [Entomophthora muscae]
MADDIDVESWLEAPYKPEAPTDIQQSEPLRSSKHIETSRSSGSDRRRERDSKESSRRRSRSRERSHRSSRHRSRSQERDRRHHRSSRRSRSRSRSSRHRRERSSDRHRSSRDSRRDRTPPKIIRKERTPSPILSEHDRDQLSFEIFFSKVGRVRDARIVSDRNSRRSKGVGYVEFYDIKSVEPALALTGHKLLGIPVIVQNTEAEKNRIAEANAAALRCATSSSLSSHRLYIGNLQYNLSEEDLKALFEPFGAIDLIEIPKDLATGRGRGYAFIQYA